jgi:integrase
MREPRVSIQDLWYATKDGKADLSRPTARKDRGRRYRLTVIDPQGNITTEHYATKREAENRQKELLAKLVTGTYASRAAGRVSFGEVAEMWYESKKVRLKGKTLEGYRSLLDTQVLPKWENTPVGDIDWQSIQKWIGDLNSTKPTRRKSEGLSASRVVQAYHVFRGVLSYAVRSRMLSVNPATDIDLPRKLPADRKYLTHQQVADLAAGCGEYDAMVLVLGYCGLRYGEAIALKRRDVHVDRARIEVKAAVERVNGNYKLGTTKTHETRSVPIPQPVLDLLRDRLSGSPDGLVFPGADGFLKNHEFRKVFDPAATKAGLTGLSPHELRHTCASLAIRSGANIKTVQRLLGHATATMTLDNYGHLYPDDLDKVAQQMGAECAYPVRTQKARKAVHLPKQEG